MSNIDNTVIEYFLSVDLTHKSVRQKRMSFSAKKYATINEAMERLVAIGFIKETHYSECMSNVIFIKEDKRKMENAHKLHEPKQSLPQRQLPFA